MYFRFSRIVADPFGDGSCLAWWPFQKDLTDHANNHNPVNPDIPPIEPVERGWRSAAFSPTSYLEMNNPGDIPSGNDPWTVSLWFYSDFSQTYHWGVVNDDGYETVVWGQATTQHYQRVRVWITTKYLITEFYYDLYKCDVAPNSTIDKIIHVVSTYDGTSTDNVRMYLNGVETPGTSNQNVPLDVIPTNVTINQDNNTGTIQTQIFNAWNVRIFDRALSPAEVSSLYEMERWDIPPFHRLVGV